MHIAATPFSGRAAIADGHGAARRVGQLFIIITVILGQERAPMTFLSHQRS